MKKKNLLLVLSLTCFSFSVFAEDAQKASEMTKPLSETASKEAQIRAHKKVEASKKDLLKKLKNQDSAEEIGNAKTRVQIDRTESNRQDYLDQEKKKSAQKECTSTECPDYTK